MPSNYVITMMLPGYSKDRIKHMKIRLTSAKDIGIMDVSK